MADIVQDFKIVASSLWEDGRGLILLTVAAGWFLSIGMRFVYPTLAPFFGAEFNLDLATTGLLLTMLWAAYAIGHIPGGVLGDRIGEGNILVFSTIVSAGTVLVVTISVNVWMMIIGTVAFGVATALYGPTRITIFTDIYSDQAGSAIGLTMAAGSIGNTILPVITAVIATTLTWRVGFGVFFPLFVAVAVVLWAVVPGRTSPQLESSNVLSVDTFKRVVEGIRNDSIPVIVVIQVCLSFIMQGFSSFYPTYLNVNKGLSPESAATLFGLFFGIGAFVQPLSGNTMDRFGPRKTLTIFLGGSVLAFWMIPFIEGYLPIIAVTALVSSLNGCMVVTQTYIADSLPADVQGIGLGTLKANWIMIGATSPLLVGLLADYSYFDEAFLLFAVIGSLGLFLTITQMR